MYNNEFFSNMHWHFYIYDKRLFFESLKELDAAQSKNGSSGLKKIANDLLGCLEQDCNSVENDQEFQEFMQFVDNSDSIKKYIGLYFERAGIILSRISNSSGGEFEADDLLQLQEYYTRYKASAFFKVAWFYANRYHASDIFFKVCMDDKTWNKIVFPDHETHHLDREMYLSCVLDKTEANAIVSIISSKKIKDNDFIINDKIFFQGLKGIIDDKFIIVYKSDV